MWPTTYDAQLFMLRWSDHGWRDTNGDGVFDHKKLLHASKGAGGHGRNDLALGSDQKIYAIHGDSVHLP